MRIGIVGSGYVGLVSAACFAEKGNDVILMDIDKDKITAINEGRLPIYEPGLEELIKSTRKHLSFTPDISDIASSDVIFIAVGTPDGQNGAISTRYIMEAADSIGEATKKYTDKFQVVAVKSTVPPGTTRNVGDLIKRYRSSDDNFAMAANPEFLKEGSAIEDFRKPDRVIVGTESERARVLFSELYTPFMRTKERMIFMGIESAELTKLMANAMLATRIALMNETADLAGKIGADIEEVRIGIGSDPRIGQQFLFPGPGFGGSCLPKDVSGLAEYARISGAHLSIVDAVGRSNRTQWYWLADTALDFLKDIRETKTYAIWGASFKPRTDDIRHSATLYTARRLLEHNASEVRIYDPQDKALLNIEKEFTGDERVRCFRDVYDVLNGCHALLIAADCDEFKGIDLTKARERLKHKVIIDSRNLYNPRLMDGLGFDYVSLGRRKVLARV